MTCSTHEGIADMRDKGLISKNDRLIHKYRASTHEEAMSIRNLRLGWEPYVPNGKAEKCPKNCGSYYYPEGSGQCPYCGNITM